MEAVMSLATAGISKAELRERERAARAELRRRLRANRERERASQRMVAVVCKTTSAQRSSTGTLDELFG